MGSKQGTPLCTHPNHILGCPQVIFIACNSKDLVVSYYYFNQMVKMHPDPGTLGEFLETFMAGKGEPQGAHSEILVGRMPPTTLLF